ncbi:MAG TPA: hypothetical protein VGH74_15195, partial [Planctomycetaceae bacterium]
HHNDRQVADRNTASPPDVAEAPQGEPNRSSASAAGEPPRAQAEPANENSTDGAEKVASKAMKPGPPAASPDDSDRRQKPPPLPEEGDKPPSSPADPQADRDVLVAQANSKAIQAIAWGRDGSRLAAAGEDPIVRIWNTIDPAGPVKLDVQHAPVMALAWSVVDEPCLAATRGDRSIAIWEKSAQGSPFTVLGPHGNQVTALAWGGDTARLFSGDDAGNLNVWDVQPGQKPDNVDTAKLAGGIRVLRSFRDAESRWLAASGHQDASIVFWDLEGKLPKIRRMILPGDGAIWDRLVDADREDNAADPAADEGDFSGQRRRKPQKKPVGKRAPLATTAQKAQRLKATPFDAYERETCLDLAVCPGSRLLAVAKYDVEIWDFNPPAISIRIRTLPGGEKKRRYRKLSWNHDGTLFAAADSLGRVQIWETQRWEPVVFRQFKTTASALAWEPGAAARLATAFEDGSIRILSIAPPYERKSLSRAPLELFDEARQHARDEKWDEVSRAVALLRSCDMSDSDRETLNSLQSSLENAAQSRLVALKERSAENRPRKQRPIVRPRSPDDEPSEDDYIDIVRKHQEIIDLAPDGPAGKEARQMLESLPVRP